MNSSLDDGRYSLGRNREEKRVMLTADTVGGVWSYALDLARMYQKAGYDTLLAAIGPEIEDAQGREAEAIPGLRFEYLRAALEWMPDPWDDVERTREWLRHLEKDFQPDITHLNQYCYATAGFESPCLVVAHSCVYSWFEATRGAEPGAEWEPYRREVAAGIAAADGVTGISDTLLDGLEKWYGPFRRLPAIRNGRELGPVGDSPVKRNWILSAGRIWDEAKNIALLDEIAPQLSWPIKVAGRAEPPEGRPGPALQNVKILGRLSGACLREEMGAASIYAAPAMYEPFGLAILEAAAAGCALALSDIPSLRELWDGAALFISPRNPQGWANALRQLIDDEAMRHHLGDLARQRARSNAFSASSMAKSYLRCYDKIVEASYAARHTVER